MHTTCTVFAGACLLVSMESANAALPVLKTDMLAAGEFSLSLGQTQETSEANYALNLPPSAFVGRYDGEQETTWLSVSGGISGRLDWAISAGLQNSEDNFDKYGPTHWQTRYNAKGLTDLSVATSYRFFTRDAWAWQGGLQATLPTASDAPGTPTDYVNGTLVATGSDWGVGKGEIAGSVFFDGSWRGEHHALEIGSDLYVSEDDASQFGKQLAVSWVYLPSPRIYTRLQASTGHVESSNNDGQAFQSSYGSYGGLFTIAWIPSTGTRLWLSTSHYVYDDVTTFYALSGNSDAYQGRRRTIVGAGLNVLLN